ncbi:two-component system response regulator CseB [Kitasatospora kifunensis]|uniref:DNA-binding response OmpR family regulator n=1 Tax=Kitasatospora kifunensis TaxID=58351 RepID=A0A7W7R2D3_KITKI|nr:two-component system response regulator CseB [Kitasatospora kifunensis]MBB4924005.1 DNA-binding response OmpR family regulator [Kitasatospora kifunensis]
MTRPATATGPLSETVRVLLVEDDDVIRRSVALSLERYGYQVTTAPDGLSGLQLARAGGHDVLVLDVMLPELDGISLCRLVRESGLTPVLMMSARGDALDVVAGLEAGADDYVVKPVDTAVLVARIRSLLRRATYSPATPAAAATRTAPGALPAPAQAPTAPTGLLVFGDLRIDTLGMEVFLAQQPVSLTPTELRLLLEFAASPGIVLDRHTLLRNVWDYGWDGDSRVVDLAVQRLRKKVGADRIETVRGFGYKLRR